MNFLIQSLAVMCLFVMLPLEAGASRLDAKASVPERARSFAADHSSAASISDYQSDKMQKVARWRVSNHWDTFGPLIIGLALMALPMGFRNLRAGSKVEPGQEASDSNLRHIGRSWDPRF